MPYIYDCGSTFGCVDKNSQLFQVTEWHKTFPLFLAFSQGKNSLLKTKTSYWEKLIEATHKKRLIILCFDIYLLFFDLLVKQFLLLFLNLKLLFHCFL